MSSSFYQLPKPFAQARPKTLLGKRNQGRAGFVALRIQLLRLGEGRLRETDQAERLLALAEFQPKQIVDGIPFHSLLEQFQREHKLFVVKPDSRREPGHKPVSWREQQRLFKTIIRAGFSPREHHVPAREPDVGRVAAFLDRGVGKRERALQISAASERDGFRGEQFGLV